jgi:OFA family oxalate/formate antiporter-like MFS transporter
LNRWFRLAAAVVAMIMIANLQYAWTFFVEPLQKAHTGWRLDQIQWAFTLFVAFETWVMPCSGWIIDLLGPRAFMSVAGLMCGVGWTMMGHAETLTELYLYYSLAGFGAALVYCGSIGIALKWFADKRGLAAGLIAAGFGSGAALFTAMIAGMIAHDGYRNTFLYTGIGQGLIIIIAAQFLQNPARGSTPAQAVQHAKIHSSGHEFNSWQMLQTPHFYMLFAMALMMGIGGLMITAQIKPMANSLKIAAATVQLSVTLNLIANGSGRLFWGWVSDHIGRERTMTIAFLLHSLFLLGAVTVAKGSASLFVTCSALVFFTWGEIYSLMPSAIGDYFGSKNASSNYGFVYSAKGVASILAGGLAAQLFRKTGTWDYGFYICAGLALLAALMTLVLHGMPRPHKPEPSSSSAGAAVVVGG